MDMKKWDDERRLQFAKDNKMPCFECGLIGQDDNGEVVTKLSECPDDGCSDCPIVTGEGSINCNLSTEELQRVLEFRWR